MPGPAFAVLGAGEQGIDDGGEVEAACGLVLFRERGRQSGQIERSTAKQDGVAGLRGGGLIAKQKRIDRMRVR